MSNCHQSLERRKDIFYHLSSPPDPDLYFLTECSIVQSSTCTSSHSLMHLYLLLFGRHPFFLRNSSTWTLHQNRYLAYIFPFCEKLWNDFFFKIDHLQSLGVRAQTDKSSSPIVSLLMFMFDKNMIHVLFLFWFVCYVCLVLLFLVLSNFSSSPDNNFDVFLPFLGGPSHSWGLSLWHNWQSGPCHGADRVTQEFSWGWGCDRK